MIKKDVLQQFYNDKATLNEVRDYLMAYLQDEAVRMLFEKEDTSGVVQARDMIRKAFDHLDEVFEPKPTKKVVNDSK